MTFLDLEIGQVFVDVACGGLWQKATETSAKCVEADSAYEVGDVAGFKPHEAAHIQAAEAA